LKNRISAYKRCPFHKALGNEQAIKGITVVLGEVI